MREYVWEDTVGVYRPVFVWIMCVLQTTVFAYSLFANDCPAYADERNAAAAALNITQVTPLPACPALLCPRTSRLLHQHLIVHPPPRRTPQRNFRQTIGE